MITRAELFELASSTFLCEHLPDNWNELDEDQQNEFLEDTAWQPFEYSDGDWLHESIRSHAQYIEHFLKEKGVDIED